MRGPKPRFPVRLTVWVPEQVAESFEQLEASGILSQSDYMRDALITYLAARGISTAPRPIVQAAE